MSNPTQASRTVRLYSELPDDELLFSSMSATEGMSTLFEYDVDVISTNTSLDLNALLGTKIKIEMDMDRGGIRYFHGIVSQCSNKSSSDDHTHYHMVVRPWFWLLSRTSDCRIFQEKSVVDIITEIFQEEGFSSDIENRLSSSYAAWDYCVQYRETDFNFISRLMEQEGIYYFFEHTEEGHKLVLCDSYSAHETAENYDSVKYYAATNTQRNEDAIDHWNIKTNLQPGKFVYRDFDFEDPMADMMVNSSFSVGHTRDQYEIYDYPGEYPSKGDGEKLIKFRMEEAQAQTEILEGGGDVQGLSTGALFTLTDCEREDQNREYLITNASYSLTENSFRSGGGSGVTFKCYVRTILGEQQFRAPRITPKPIVQGPQTAIVVGPAGEEIWTDEHGRVKLQFHWDRYGESDENSSCWIRVSQLWAGEGWGGIHIPRIGQEVIVECLEGDPDRPIITGRVYNGKNSVPYDLPANATQSGIKSRSSKGGSSSNFNEIRMEDKKGEEELFVHAEKDQNNVVKNNESTSVGVDRSESVGNDESVDIGNDKTITVGNDEIYDIANNETRSVGADSVLTVAANLSSEVGETAYYKVGSDIEEDYGTSQKTKVGTDMELDVGTSILIKAGTSIKLETGASSIEMDAGGNISIKGLNVAIEGSAMVGIKGGIVTSEADAMHTTKGTLVMSEGAATNTIKGGVVMLNP